MDSQALRNDPHKTCNCAKQYKRDRAAALELQALERTGDAFDVIEHVISQSYPLLAVQNDAALVEIIHRYGTAMQVYDILGNEEELLRFARIAKHDGFVGASGKGSGSSFRHQNQHGSRLCEKSQPPDKTASWCCDSSLNLQRGKSIKDETVTQGLKKSSQPCGEKRQPGRSHSATADANLEQASAKLEQSAELAFPDANGKPAINGFLTGAQDCGGSGGFQTPFEYCRSPLSQSPRVDDCSDMVQEEQQRSVFVNGAFISASTASLLRLATARAAASRVGGGFGISLTTTEQRRNDLDTEFQKRCCLGNCCGLFELLKSEGQGDLINGTTRERSAPPKRGAGIKWVAYSKFSSFRPLAGSLLHRVLTHPRPEKLRGECPQAWITAFNDAPRLSVKFRHYSDNPMKISFVVEGIVESPLIDILSVLNETDLFKVWLPYFTTPMKLGLRDVCRKQLGRVDQTVQFHVDFPWPFANRDMLFEVWGLDDFERNSGIIVKMTMADGSNPRWQHPVEPPEIGVERICVDGSLFIRPLGPSQSLLQLLWDENCGMTVPSSMVQFASKVFAKSSFDRFRSACAAAASGPHAARRAENRFLYDFVENRLSALKLLCHSTE